MPSHGPLSSIHDLRVAIQDIYKRLDHLAPDHLALDRKAGEVLYKGMVVFPDENGTWHMASSAGVVTAPRTGYAVLRGAGQAGDVLQGVTSGRVEGLSGLIPGVMYYLGQGGTLVASDSEPVVVALGRAISETELLMQPQYIGP